MFKKTEKKDEKTPEVSEIFKRCVDEYLGAVCVPFNMHLDILDGYTVEVLGYCPRDSTFSAKFPDGTKYITKEQLATLANNAREYNFY